MTAKRTSARLAKLAARCVDDGIATPVEVKALAASVLSQRALPAVRPSAKQKFANMLRDPVVRAVVADIATNAVKRRRARGD